MRSWPLGEFGYWGIALAKAVRRLPQIEKSYPEVELGNIFLVHEDSATTEGRTRVTLPEFPRIYFLAQGEKGRYISRLVCYFRICMYQKTWNATGIKS